MLLMKGDIKIEEAATVTIHDHLQNVGDISWWYVINFKIFHLKSIRCS